jgi:hypothetical protein
MEMEKEAKPSGVKMKTLDMEGRGQAFVSKGVHLIDLKGYSISGVN